MSKRATLLLNTILIVSSLIMVETAFAQSIPKPSAPEFSAKVVATTIKVLIKNQPLTPYENGSYPSLYYMFRFKDPTTMIGFWYYDPIYFVLPSTYGGYYQASDSDFTIVSLFIEDQHFPTGQIEIRAMALVGNQYPTNQQNGTVYGFEGVKSGWSNTQTITVGESQTATPSPATTPTGTPTPTEEPHQLITGETIVGVAITATVIFAGLSLLVYLIKKK